MPELPEVEITARRLDAALRGARIESALAPGINTLKSVRPPLEALVGRPIDAVRRRGKPRLQPNYPRSTPRSPASKRKCRGPTKAAKSPTS